MKIIRFTEKNCFNQISYGRLDDKKIFKLLNSPYDEMLEFSEQSLGLSTVELLTPVSPQKIICIATNYSGSTGVDHKMVEPVIFLKGNNTITSGKEVVHLPFQLNCWGESELGFVVKKTIKDIGYKENNLPLPKFKTYSNNKNIDRAITKLQTGHTKLKSYTTNPSK